MSEKINAGNIVRTARLVAARYPPSKRVEVYDYALGELWISRRGKPFWPSIQYTALNYRTRKWKRDNAECRDISRSVPIDEATDTAARDTGQDRVDAADMVRHLMRVVSPAHRELMQRMLDRPGDSISAIAREMGVKPNTLHARFAALREYARTLDL